MSEDNARPALIIPGYQGVMDLDLTDIPASQHAEMVAVHCADIEEYKIDQMSRPKRLRYENTIVRVRAHEKLCRELDCKRAEKEEAVWMQRYNERVALSKMHHFTHAHTPKN